MASTLSLLAKINSNPDEMEPSGENLETLLKIKKSKRTPKQKKRIKMLQEREKGQNVLRDELEREDKYGEKTRKKLEKRWRKMLLDIKLPILKKEFTYAMNNAERMIDAKDYIISLTLDEIDTASEQYQLNLQTHIENVDRVITLFHERLLQLRENYEEDLKDLFFDKDDEIELLTKRKDIDNDFLNMMIYGLEVENKNHIKDIRSEYLSKISAETKRYDQLLVLQKAELGRTWERMWAQYEKVAKDFLEQTAERRKDYEKLKERDTVMRNVMNDQIKSILKVYEDISSEKNLQAYQRTVIKEAERDLLEEVDCFGNAFNTLKAKLQRYIKKDTSQLIILTELSNASIKNLNDTKLKGEKLLRLMTLCRKYETEYEKILSFPGPKCEAVHSAKDKFPMMRTLLNIGIQEPRGLDNFWQKCGQADATRHILNQEKEYLLKENEHLKNALKKYCTKNICRCNFFPNISKMPSDECVLIYKKN